MFLNVSQTANKRSEVTCSGRIPKCMHAAAFALLQWKVTKLPLAVAGYQTACMHAAAAGDMLQWQDTKLHARGGGCCPAAVAGYQTAYSRGCPAVVSGYQTASLSKGRANLQQQQQKQQQNQQLPKQDVYCGALQALAGNKATGLRPDNSTAALQAYSLRAAT
jgi:hypothetical protein